MSGLGWFAIGVLAATAAWSVIAPSSSSCCQRVALGARDVIAGYTGPLAPVTSAVLDATGLTAQLPGLLDLFGVPKG